MIGRTRARRRAMIAAVPLVALAGGATYLMTRGPPVAVREAIVVVASEGTTPPLDPHRMTGTIGLRIVDAIFDPLVREDVSKPTAGAPEIKPALAELWKVSPDGRTYEFSIRGGVAFHDGTPLDAAAVKKNFDRLMDKDSPVYDERAARTLSPLTTWIESTAAIRQQGFVIRLKQPFAGLLRLLTDQRMSMVSPKALDQYKGDELSLHPIGTGPYQLDKLDPGQQVELLRNPHFWGEKPKLDRIVFRPVLDPATAATALQAGQVDMIPSAGAQQIEQVKDQKGVTVQYPEPANLHFIRYNMRLAPTDNQQFRRALNFAVNRDAIATLVNGQMKPIYGAVPRGNEIFQEGLAAPYAYDPKKARDLIAAAGVATPLTLKLMVPVSGPENATARQIFTLIQQDLKAVGVEVEPQFLELTAMNSTEAGGYADVHGSYDGWIAGTDAGYWYERMFGGDQQPPRGVNRGYYRNEKVDALFDKARGDGDEKRRRELYREAAKLIAEDAPWLFLYQDRLPRILGPRLTGVAPAPSVFFDYTTIAVR